jgi:hypothetical protein
MHPCASSLASCSPWASPCAARGAAGAGATHAPATGSSACAPPSAGSRSSRARTSPGRFVGGPIRKPGWTEGSCRRRTRLTPPACRGSSPLGGIRRFLAGPCVATDWPTSAIEEVELGPHRRQGAHDRSRARLPGEEVELGSARGRRWGTGWAGRRSPGWASASSSSSSTRSPSTSSSPTRTYRHRRTEGSAVTPLALLEVLLALPCAPVPPAACHDHEP